MTGLVGNSNEADIKVEGVATSALLDTGASVSTVSEQFYRTHLQHVELQRVDKLLKIECANGDVLGGGIVRVCSPSGF
jgi:predicted aspartyl protease